MAKFCVYCGKPLKEGEVCSCRSQAAETPSGQPQEPKGAETRTAAAAPNTAGVCWQLAKDAFRAPASVLPSFAASGVCKSAVIFLCTRALTFALFMVVLCNQIKASIGSWLDKRAGTLVSNGAEQYITFPLGKIFVLSLLLSAAAALLFAGILLLFAKGAFKADTAYANMLCVSSAGGIAAVPFLLFGLLFLFLDVRFGVCVAAFGILLQMLFVVSAFGRNVLPDANKSVYALFLSFAVQLIVLVIFVKVFSPMYLPDALQEGVKQIQNGNLQNLFQ